MKRNLLIIAVIAGVAAIAWRASLFSVSVHNIPAFDDECKIALQAKQISHGDLPLMILASPYLFPLEAYLMAPFIHFLPRDAFGVRIMAFGFGLLTVFLSLLILKRWGSWQEIWPGIVLVLFPSGYLLVYQVGCAMPGYPTMMLLAALVIWLALRHSEAERRLWAWALLGGIAAGLAASDTMLAVPVLVMGGAMFAAARNWQTARISAPVYAIGALIGFAPHIAARHFHSGAFQSVSQSVPLGEAFRKILHPLLDRVLPSAFGWGPTIFPDSKERVAWPDGFDIYIGTAIVVLLAVVTVIGLNESIRRWWQERWPRVDSSLAFLGISWMCLVLFIFSHRSHAHTYRYLLPVVWSFPFILAYAYRRSGRVVRWIIGAVTVLLLAVNVTGTCRIMQRWSSPGFSDYLKSYDMGPMIEYLGKRGITRCYGTYVDAYRITLATDERIICCQFYNERFPGWRVPFKELVDPATNVAFVLSDSYRFKPDEFEKDLADMKVKYRKKVCGNFSIFSDFESLLPATGPEVPPQDLIFTTCSNQQQAKALNDGNLLTRWQAHNLQEKGMWIEISMKSAQPVSQVKIYYNLYRFDRANGMCLLAYDGHNWTNVNDGVSRKLDCFEFKNGHPVYGDEVQTIRFPAKVTDRLRLEITQPEAKRDWTIGEIKVFSSGN